MDIPHPIDLYDVARFFSKVNVLGEYDCWNFIGKRTNKGYGQIGVIGQTWYAHRFSYLLFNKKLDPDLLVRHKCDNRLCVNPYHLETGTHQDNMRDRNIRGRTAKGVRNPKSKLTEKEVLEIYKDQRIYKDIAKQYNVLPDTISRIKSGKNWGHVTGATPPKRY